MPTLVWFVAKAGGTALWKVALVVGSIIVTAAGAGYKAGKKK